MTSERIGRYSVLDEIAAGAQGAVFRAYDPRSRRVVALKVLHPELSRNRQYVERFRREASLAAATSHPNIVQVFEVGEDDGRHYMAVEFLPESLARIIEARPLPVQAAAAYAAQIADGLGAAHRAGVVHRDVKPQNVLIGADGVAKVSDFGIARGEAMTTMTATGVMMGTPHYMSPEQAEGKRADARSDIYALGCVLYQMLAGEVPFTGTTPLAVIRRHIDEAPQPIRERRDDVPKALAAVVARALNKDPERRFQSAAELAAAIRAAVPGVADELATSAVAAGTRPATVEYRASSPGDPWPSRDDIDEALGEGGRRGRWRRRALRLALVSTLIVTGVVIAGAVSQIGSRGDSGLPSFSNPRDRLVYTPAPTPRAPRVAIVSSPTRVPSPTSVVARPTPTAAPARPVAIAFAPSPQPAPSPAPALPATPTPSPRPTAEPAAPPVARPPATPTATAAQSQQPSQTTIAARPTPTSPTPDIPREPVLTVFQGKAILGASRIRLSRIYDLGKPVIVNFWSGNASRSRSDISLLQALHTAFEDRLLVVGVAVGRASGIDILQDTRKLMRQLRPTYPMAATGDRRVLEQAGATSLPVTMFADGQGNLIRQWTGPLERNQLFALAERLAGGPPDRSRTAVVRRPVPARTPAPSVTLRVSAGRDLSASAGGTVALNGAAGASSPPGRRLFAAVDWGDRTGFSSAVLVPETGEIVASHVYSRPGTYDVSVRVTGSSGLTATDMTTVRVGASPRRTPGPRTAPVPATIKVGPGARLSGSANVDVSLLGALTASSSRASIRDLAGR